jgi:hypothetical protein
MHYFVAGLGSGKVNCSGFVVLIFLSGLPKQLF